MEMYSTCQARAVYFELTRVWWVVSYSLEEKCIEDSPRHFAPKHDGNMLTNRAVLKLSFVPYLKYKLKNNLRN